MRKFKIKNRRKRKYVRKNSVTATPTFTHSITVGVIPVLLMAAVALFATYIIATPIVISNLPTISLPQLSVTMPNVPKWEISFTFPSIPVIAPPTLPEIVVPDVRPAIIDSVNIFSKTLNVVFSELITIFSAIGEFINYTANTFQTFIISTLHKEFMFAENNWTATGEAIIWGTQTTTQAITLVTKYTLELLRTLGIVIADTVSTSINFLQTWSVLLMNALIKTMGDIIWFLGTPFRALDAALKEMAVFLTPFMDVIAASIKHALDDLAAGGEALRQTTDYVTGSVASQ